MKRHFLSTVCSTILVAFFGHTTMAQQDASPSKADNSIIIIQKTKNEDGTVTVKKKSIQKGETPSEYANELDLNNELINVSEVTVLTGDAAKLESTDAETIIFIRQGKNAKEIKWDEANMLEGFKVFEKSDLALIGDTEGIENEPKAFLGIYPETNEDGGVLVTDIVPGSGAANAGLRSGDVITAMDETSLRNHGDLSTTLASKKPGDAIAVSYLRNGQELSATVTLTGRQQRNYSYTYSFKNERGPCDVFIGVTIGSWKNGEEGVGVDGIIPGWPAENAGLQAGDRITSIDGVPVNTHNELVVERDKHKAGDYFTIGYLRNGQSSEVKARFKVCPGVAEPEATTPETGQVQKTEVPPVSNELQLEELKAFPNPTYGDLNIQFKGDAVPTTVTITDITGKTIFSEKVKNFDGYYNRQVDVSQGAAGTLLISIRQDGKVLTQPVVLLNRA